MSVSVDGFIADRDGALGWSVPSDELFRFHLARVRELGSCLLGRRLYETMLAWETDPSLRDNPRAHSRRVGLTLRSEAVLPLVEQPAVVRDGGGVRTRRPQ